MKRLLTLSLVVYSLTTVKAQTDMRLSLNDGRVLSFPIDSISAITIEPVAPASLEGLTGRWQLIAMPNGYVDANGVYTSKPDTIDFVATVASDGTSLHCTAERFYTRTGQVYPAHWSMLVEQNEQSGQRRVGWVLDASQPASDKEFVEDIGKYLDGGYFYWGGGSQDNGRRHIYLLSENIDTQRLEGMTLWSGWMAGAAQTYTFPQNQEVYGVVSVAIPYQPGTSVGYIDIWASPRFIKLP